MIEAVLLGDLLEEGLRGSTWPNQIFFSGVVLRLFARQGIKHVNNSAVFGLINLRRLHRHLCELGSASKAIQINYANFQKSSHCMDADTIGIAAPPFNPCGFTQCQSPSA